MKAVSDRILQDINKLKELSSKTNNKISINRTEGSPPNAVFLHFKYVTAPDSSFPSKKQDLSEVRIDLANNYPFNEPTAKFLTPIYHPNVYESGKICLGKKWLATQTLDFLAERIAKIIIFDPDILDASDAANSKARNWYLNLKSNNPNLFPTDQFLITGNKNTPKIKWTDKN